MSADNCALAAAARPFIAVWRLLGFVVLLMLRSCAALLAMGLMAAGIALTMTIVGAPIGIPLAILGLLLLLRSVF